MSTDDLAHLEAEPHLAPFVREGDTDLRGARARWRAAQSAAKAELHARGVRLHRRARTRGGMETTAVQLGGEDRG